MDKKGKNRKGIMYSTNPDFEYKYENEELETLTNNKQNLKVCIDKHRAGKIAVIIKEFVGTTEDLKSLDEETFLSVFDGVPQFKINPSELNTQILTLLAEKTQVFNSKGEARRMISSNSISINKEKITENFQLSENDLLSEKYILVQKGKKNYF